VDQFQAAAITERVFERALDQTADSATVMRAMSVVTAANIALSQIAEQNSRIAAIEAFISGKPKDEANNASELENQS
jgi:hypothetical protein